jgi:hypothetical protein
MKFKILRNTIKHLSVFEVSNQKSSVYMLYILTPACTYARIHTTSHIQTKQVPRLIHTSCRVGFCVKTRPPVKLQWTCLLNMTLQLSNKINTQTWTQINLQEKSQLFSCENLPALLSNYHNSVNKFSFWLWNGDLCHRLLWQPGYTNEKN